MFKREYVKTFCVFGDVYIKLHKKLISKILIMNNENSSFAIRLYLMSFLKSTRFRQNLSSSLAYSDISNDMHNEDFSMNKCN